MRNPTSSPLPRASRASRAACAAVAVALGVVGFEAAIFGCSSSGAAAAPAANDGGGAGTAETGSEGEAGDALPADAGKAPLTGLLDMGLVHIDGPEDAGITDKPEEVAPFAASFGGLVINLSWGALQPTMGATLGAGNLLDQELASIRAYNAAHPSSPLALKLRVSAGFDAPDWAKAIGGDPIPITLTKNVRGNVQTKSGTVGRWWTQAYIDAWRAFQSALAASYDGEPLLREMAITSCGVPTDEPFVPILDTEVLTLLHAAGYSDAAQRSCLSGALTDYAAWQRTWADFTFNAFTSVDSRPFAQDTAFTTSVMQGCTIASHCILATHYLDQPLAFKDDGGQDQNIFIYQQMQNQPASLTDFQTAAPKLLDWCGALENAYKLKGRSVEIWPDFNGFTTLAPAAVANLATILQTGAPGDPSLCPPAP